MLTIGELATLAGTTVRTVRHYHAIGLLPEPPRDRSGYRRYGAAALVALLRIRGMRELGLPLPRIAELLTAPDPDLHAELDVLDAELAAQAARIDVRRARLAALRERSGDPELPPPLDAIFAGAVADGLPARALLMDKEMILLDLALHPDRADELVAGYVAQYGRLRADPDQARMAADVDALADTDPDDPRVEEVAQRMAGLVRAEVERSAGRDLTPSAAGLFRDWSTTLPPAQQRLMQRLQELLPDVPVV